MYFSKQPYTVSGKEKGKPMMDNAPMMDNSSIMNNAPMMNNSQMMDNTTDIDDLQIMDDKSQISENQSNNNQMMNDSMMKNQAPKQSAGVRMRNHIPSKTMPSMATRNTIPRQLPDEASRIAPQTLTDIYFTPGFLRTQIGKRLRVEFLVGTNGPLVDRTGTLKYVGASYIIIQPSDSDDLLMCDIYSIKFATILL